ncbi:MAG TPA: TonB family protein [Candidatus Binatia bacterium]|nr:TonB family protein [Candidatus Binatia bacterium]
MTQAVARATSLGASALLMGGAVLFALTMTYTIVPSFDPPPPGTIEMTPEPAPPPPPTPRTQPRTQPLEELVVDPLPPLTPVSRSTGAERPSIGPIAPTGPVEVTRPHWLEQPRNLARYYPRRALERSIEGDVVLNCLVRVSGLLDCAVVSENPAGWGFSQAALRISGAYRMTPATRGGVAVEGRYTMRVPFRID